MELYEFYVLLDSLVVRIGVTFHCPKGLKFRLLT